MSYRGVVGTTLVVGWLVATPGFAQEPAAPGPADAREGAVVRGCCTDGAPILEATLLTGEIDVDGRMDEAAWGRASVAADFVQFQPDEGAPPSQRTEARVLYGPDALYVFMRAFDSSPDSIAGQLTRRDQDSYSDLLGVVVDSYFDRRTAFHFAVNPVGVKHDIYRFDDTSEDAGWDAVWDVATLRDAEGWTAEFRIPFSQLRFRDQRVQTWGINFVRDLARHDEMAVWAPTSPQESAIVSRFGELRGLEGLQAPNRLELVPYTLAGLERVGGDARNPFYRKNQTLGAVGADLKYGVTSDLTLDVTLNPDFGQVEADPAQVNLSAFETFLPERRPFFLEGASIFNFGIALGDGDQANESLFYSRRIGRAPQGRADARGGYADADDRTTILGAWKLSGKTAGGWSIGALHAVTAEETARVAPATGDRLDDSVEPFSNYGVLRLQKDFREGRSALGFIGTHVNRDKTVADELGLRSGAVAGGLDWRHRFASEAYQIEGYLLGSHVRGSTDAIRTTQRSPLRYFQRPDADHVTFDPERTSLSGGSAFLSVGKIAGEHWRFSTGIHTRTPGFEVNDLGYQRDADSWSSWFWVGYQQTTPQGPFRRWNLNTNGWVGGNYGGDRGGLGGNVNGSVQFKNFWHAYGGLNRDAGGYSGQFLRGGPLFRREAGTNFWSGFGTDSRKPLMLNLNTWGNVRSESDSWNVGLSPNVRIRPSGRATFNVGAQVSRFVDDRQWVGRVDLDQPHYVFGRIDQTTVGLTLRTDYAFTPTLSLQLYAQPFVSAGAYSEFKRVADPVADAYSDRFALLGGQTGPDGTGLDLDGDGGVDATVAPDFEFMQFRSNAVLRWEYLPGSALFVVWSQGRNRYGSEGSFALDDFRSLFGAHPDNVFMVKLTYWMSR
ncbi:MAG: DUF5916 domain-containing protein [Longimicrobiales bacterium]